MKAVRILLMLFRELFRWLNRHNRPELSAEVLRTPYWGGISLPLLVRNTGKAAARDCRYCRRQRFSMPRGQALATAIAYYATGSFHVPADGSEVRLTTYATSDACPRLILEDMPQDGHFEAALVCKDRFGTFYRFTLADGGEPQTDVWRPSLLTRLLRREPPAWTRWVSLPEGVQSREWAAGFV